jgi:hypothetical protein
VAARRRLSEFGPVASPFAHVRSLTVRPVRLGETLPAAAVMAWLLRATPRLRRLVLRVDYRTDVP